MFRIGDRVRVTAINNSNAYKGLVSTCNSSVISRNAASYDILYEAGSGSPIDEEDDVHESRLSHIEDFERDKNNDCSYSAAQLKEQGNILFCKKDFEASQSRYIRALDCLIETKKRLEIGAIVLYISNQNVTPAIISDVDVSTNRFGLIFNDSSIEDVEVSQETLVVISKESADCELQRALYMNMSRCSSKLGKYGWAVRWATFAVAITKHMIEASSSCEHGSNISAKLADAYYLRGKALLYAGRPGLAKQEASRLHEVDATRAESLLKDIQLFVTKRRKLDRNLALHMTRWVEKAMSSNSSAALKEPSLPSDSEVNDSEVNLDEGDMPQDTLGHRVSTDANTNNEQKEGRSIRTNDLGDRETQDNEGNGCTCS